MTQPPTDQGELEALLDGPGGYLDPSCTPKQKQLLYRALEQYVQREREAAAKEARQKTVQQLRDYSLQIENGRWVLDSILDGLALDTPNQQERQA